MPSRTFLTSAIILAIICGITLGLPSSRAQSSMTIVDEAQKKKIFQTFAGLFFNGKGEEARSMMDERMRTALPDASLDAVRKQLQAEFGNYESIENVISRKTLISGTDSLKALCHFSNKSGELSGAINGDGKVCGFFVKPHIDFSEPPYAAHDKFIDKEIEIPSGDLRLKATLSMPVSGGPFPGVVLVHGSGPCDRDETVGAIKVFRDLAWGLASNEIAVLRYEKRTRQFPDQSINTVNDETVDDAIAAAQCLKRQKGIDQTRMVVLGHSLGAYMIPRIAQREKELAGFIICAGPTRRLEDIVVCQVAFLDSVTGGTGDSANLNKVKADCQTVKLLDKNSGNANQALLLGFKPSWWLDIQDYEPVKIAQTIKKPLLILQGDCDYQVTLDDFKGWQDGMKDRPGVTLKCYQGLAHTFTKSSDKPGPKDYDKPVNVSPEVIEDLSAWVKSLAPSPTLAPYNDKTCQNVQVLATV
jgi:dienelactone hydrolase